MKRLTPIFLGVCAAISGVSIQANEQSAHEHGAVDLSIAIEKNDVEIELQSAAHNIVGFESLSGAKEEITAINTAKKTMGKLENILAIPASAGCYLEIAEVTHSFKIDTDSHEEHDHDEHDHGHKKHDHEKHDHAHDKHDHNHKGHEHGHDQYEQGHDDHDHAGGHADFSAHYHIHCDNASAIDAIGLTLMDTYPEIKKVRYQLATDNKQAGGTLEKGDALPIK